MPLQVTIDSTTWAALALTLTIIGGALSWVVWQRRGLAAGLRGLAWTLVPVAAWLTGTLKLAVNILNDVGSWATRLVFSPSVWAGIIVAGGSAVLFVVSGQLRLRGIGVRGKAAQTTADRATRKAERLQAKGATPVTSSATAQKKAQKKARRDDDLDDMADIEAILKKHGI
jgi:hypothetical protein